MDAWKRGKGKLKIKNQRRKDEQPCLSFPKLTKAGF